MLLMGENILDVTKQSIAFSKNKIKNIQYNFQLREDKGLSYFVECRCGRDLIFILSSIMMVEATGFLLFN